MCRCRRKEVKLRVFGLAWVLHPNSQRRVAGWHPVIPLTIWSPLQLVCFNPVWVLELVFFNLWCRMGPGYDMTPLGGIVGGRSCSSSAPGSSAYCVEIPVEETAISNPAAVRALDSPACADKGEHNGSAKRVRNKVDSGVGATSAKPATGPELDL
ncbi:hypothetical protein EYF80_063042 [Liparis tanakae]|uniref:Uncharacterized protein n=1 Tax=Liparis tanakae TaxID=230148 RepID=A0A4Z2EDA4_9TELE|nr:hypothetical protein EYF80_063042 [Liparis tanakae]